MGILPRAGGKTMRERLAGLPAQGNLGSAAIAALTVVVVGVDVAAGVAPTGAVAVVVMLAVTAALLVSGLRELRARRLGRLFGLLLVAVTGFATLRAYVFGVQVLAPASAAALTYDLVWLALAGVTSGSLWAREHLVVALQQISQRPRRVLAGSFALLIVGTTLLLTLPVSVRGVASVSLVDALFTATSAVCVTGLTVNDIGKTYTVFGQGVILLAVQLGGVGIMTLAALAVTAIRDAIAHKSRYARMLEVDSIQTLRAIVRGVVVGTVAFEAVGTLLLWWLWSGRTDLGSGSKLWLALFHAVSAFCNAGFSLFSGNLARFTNDAPTQLVIMALIIVGGLGFPVWRGLGLHGGRRAWHLVKKGAARPVHSDLGTRVALLVSALLIVVGAAAFAILEWTHAFSRLSIPSSVLNACFCSVTARTAGFNTVGFEAMRDGTLLVTMALMFIGGSPGGTAGGIKTTTLAIIAAALNAELRGHEPRLLGRGLGADIVRRAVAVATISFAGVFVALFALSLTEHHSLRSLAFEVVSAFGTTGLSTGLTPLLSNAGKLILVVTMFAGRVGPLTLALAVGLERKRALHRLPNESLPVG